MTDTKPRTAGDVLELLRHADGDALLSKHCEALLDNWRSELLADGWTYLPKMPADGERVLVAKHCGGPLWVDAGFQIDGKWFEMLTGYGIPYDVIIYAWRPLPEPPPVREGE
jgi:hypothetical protein